VQQSSSKLDLTDSPTSTARKSESPDDSTNRPGNEGERGARAPVEDRSGQRLALAGRARTWWAATRPHLAFVLALLFIDVVLNLRYPGPEPDYTFLVPSVDVLAIFAYFAIFNWFGWTVPRAVRAFLVLAFFVVRVLRLGDGVQKKFFAQNFNVYTDLPLAAEAVRFAHSTLPVWKFALFSAGGLLLIVGFFVGSWWALGTAERYLKGGNIAVAVGIFSLAFVALSPLSLQPEWWDYYFGGLISSVVPRLKHETRFLFNVYSRRSERMQAITRVQKRLTNTPGNLSKLHGTNVYLIFVESYGRTVFDRPYFYARARPLFDAFEDELLDRGFAMASGTITSPTYGGHSWLAHTTMNTGVDTTDELQYELVTANHPKTMAAVFRDAGYKTVLVQPGTTREWPKGDFLNFDKKYYAWNFDYQGPGFAWATMPDQYVLDFVRRHEIDPDKGKGPLFLEYMLVSSHAPWSDLPTMVDDWDHIGNGAIYNGQERMKYPITWPYFDNASQAYIDSIMYDFNLLKQYIEQYVLDDSLIIILGDHQPVYEINGHTPFTGVPVHVLSRDGSLIEPFVARGFGRGVWPPERGNFAPMANFLVNLMQDFSTREQAPAAPTK
jgi:hypothetical protein